MSMDDYSRPAPKLVSTVSLHEKLGGIFNSQSAVAIWHADDRIGVYAFDTDSQKYTAKYFECSVHEIKWIMVSMAILTLRIDDRNYTIDFDPAALQSLVGSSLLGGVLSIAGLAIADKKSQSSDVNEWATALKNAGVSFDPLVKDPHATSIKWGLLFVAFLVVIPSIGLLLYKALQ